MTDHIKAISEMINKGDYTLKKQTAVSDETSFRDFALSFEPQFLPSDNFGFHFASDGTKKAEQSATVIPDYSSLLNRGLDYCLKELEKELGKVEKEKLDTLSTMYDYALTASAVSNLYRSSAPGSLSEALITVPSKGACNFREACVFMKFIYFLLRANGISNIPLGRFDRYMYPYFKIDLISGVSQDELFETLEEFLLSVYADVKADAEKVKISLVLGGTDKDGGDVQNELTFLVLKAITELELPLPKIYLRANKFTSLDTYEKINAVSKFTTDKPVIVNDILTIPSLEENGIPHDTAVCYGVANCLNLIPGEALAQRAREIPDLYAITVNTLKENPTCGSYSELLGTVCKKISAITTTSAAKCAMQVPEIPQIMYLFMPDCFSKYRMNYLSPVGIDRATRLLCFINKLVFEKKSKSLSECAEKIGTDTTEIDDSAFDAITETSFSLTQAYDTAVANVVKENKNSYFALPCRR